MKIKICYDIERRDKVYYGVYIMVLDEKNIPIPFSMQSKLTGNEYWIKAENLVSEEYLRSNKVEYYKDINTNELIPIGLFDFLDYNNETSISICVDDKSQLYLLGKVVNNIFTAIKEKYKIKDFYMKFKNREEEIIEV